jgi:hypothetical protein
MSTIHIDDIEAELRRIAPPTRPDPGEGWFEVKQAMQIWGLGMSATKWQIQRKLAAGELEPWPHNRPKVVAYFRVKREKAKKRR